MPPLAIQSINLFNNQITVLFNQHWFQEDIATLRQLLFNNIVNLSIKELIVGADIENVRIAWLDSEFIVNFDYYSQSCWVDAQDPQSLANIQVFYSVLRQNFEQTV